jgi:hypothetical protein
MAGGQEAGGLGGCSYRQVSGRLKSPPSDDEMQGDRTLHCRGVGDSVCCWERQRRRMRTPKPRRTMQEKFAQRREEKSFKQQTVSGNCQRMRKMRGFCADVYKRLEGERAGTLAQFPSASVGPSAGHGLSPRAVI